MTNDINNPLLIDAELLAAAEVTKRPMGDGSEMPGYRIDVTLADGTAISYTATVDGLLQTTYHVILNGAIWYNFKQRDAQETEWFLRAVAAASEVAGRQSSDRYEAQRIEVAELASRVFVAQGDPRC